MRRLRRAFEWFAYLITPKGWDQYAASPERLIDIHREDMRYESSLRTRDRDTNIVHIKDPASRNRAVCLSGFAASTMDTHVSSDTVPTCVFCIAGMPASIPQWRFLSPQAVYRRVIEGRVEDD